MSKLLPIRYSPDAQADMHKISGDLERARGSDFADRYIDRLLARIAKLATSPRRNAEREELGGERRLMPLRPYNVYYVVDADCIRIQRILHGRRRITRRTFVNER